MALGFFFDVTMCIGCRTCQVACKDRNGLKVGIVFRRVRSFETGHYPEALSYNYSGSCNHCKDARCVKGCPSGAMYHAEDGTVQHDRQKCLGCGYCTWNCPYGVPQLDEEAGIVGKCDSCKPLRDAGKNPVCVDACLMRCLEFGDLDELASRHGKNLVRELPILPSPALTNPCVAIKPKTCAFSADVREVDL
ncbi:MAG: 4Fe-4S dicluster domain-containing protein [Syntrophaceae bacterium]